MPGSDLSEWLCAESADGRAGRVVYDRSIWAIRSRRRRSWRRSAPRFAVRWPRSPRTTGSRWCGSARTTARSIGCGRIWPGKPTTGRAGVAAIGVAQEFAAGVHRDQTQRADTAVWFSFSVSQRRVTCYYFYLWDDDFGPAFVKVCAYFPYPMKVWVNGHEWAKRQATQGRHRVHRAVQRVRHLRRSRRAAGDLRSARPGHDPGVLPNAGGRSCRYR